MICDYKKLTVSFYSDMFYEDIDFEDMLDLSMIDWFLRSIDSTNTLLFFLDFYSIFSFFALNDAVCLFKVYSFFYS